MEEKNIKKIRKLFKEKKPAQRNSFNLQFKSQQLQTQGQPMDRHVLYTNNVYDQMNDRTL